MTRGLVGKDLAGRRLLLNVAAGFLPAASIGLLFNETIKTHLFGPWPVVTAWLSNNPKDEIDLADLEAKGFRPSEDVQLTVADGNQETLS